MSKSFNLCYVCREDGQLHCHALLGNGLLAGTASDPQALVLTNEKLGYLCSLMVKVVCSM
jgi:hypothetical protein